MTSRARRFVSAVAGFILVILVAGAEAQQTQPPSFGATAAVVSSPAEGATEIDLLVGRSTILNVGSPIARVSLTVPDIADAMVTSSGQLLIWQASPAISCSCGIAAAPSTYEVRCGATSVPGAVKQLFRAGDIVVSSGKTCRLRTVSRSTGWRRGDVPAAT